LHARLLHACCTHCSADGVTKAALKKSAETAAVFGVERLVAVCHSIISSHDGAAHNMDAGAVLSQVSE
jgi:hypothetical protein